MVKIKKSIIKNQEIKNQEINNQGINDQGINDQGINDHGINDQGINDKEINEQETKKKRITNKPLLVKELHDIAKSENKPTTIRHLNIACGLKRALKDIENSKYFENFYIENANILGKQRHIISLFSNYLINTKCMMQRNGVYNEVSSIPILNKTFYDNCWSSMVSFKNEKKPTKGAVYISEFENFSKITGLKKKDIPEPTRFEIRQQITFDMNTSMQRHIYSTFIKKSYVYLKNELNITIKQQLEEKYDTCSVNKIIYQLSNSVFSCVIAYPEFLENDENILKDICNEYSIEYIKIYKIVHDTRNKLKNCYDIKIPEKTEVSKKKKIKKIESILVIIKKSPNIILKFLSEISLKNKEYNEIKKDIIKKSELLLSDEERKEYVKNELKNTNVLGKNFNLLPIWKLQAAFVKYSYTVLEEQFRGKKKIDPAYIDKDLLNIDFIPQTKARNNNKNIKVTGFSTNGCQLVIEYSTLKYNNPGSFNSEGIVSKGFGGLIEPSKKIKYNEGRGIYKLTETRYDIKKLKKKEILDNDIEISVIDPGLVNMISVCSGDLKIFDSCNNIKDNGAFWNITNEEYLEETFRNDIEKEVNARRKKKEDYQVALDNLSNELKKTACTESFNNYCKEYFKYLDIFTRECLRKRVRVRNFFTKSKTDSYLQRLSNKLFNKSSYKKISENYKILTESERKNLREKIKIKKKELEDKKYITFFGNGSFGSGGYGYSSIPRKKIIKFLGNTGLTIILDEYNTSKKCPGCGSIMEDISDKRRVRRCTSEYSKTRLNENCKLSTAEGNYTDDRDYAATINMGLCSYEGLVKHKRPQSLCREKKSEIDKKISEINI